MKIFFITILLAALMLGLILTLDIKMGTPSSNLLLKMKRPFEVPEPAEYFIVIVFLTMIIAKPLGSFLKKKGKQKTSAK